MKRKSKIAGQNKFYKLTKLVELKKQLEQEEKMKLVRIQPLVYQPLAKKAEPPPEDQRPKSLMGVSLPDILIWYGDGMLNKEEAAWVSKKSGAFNRGTVIGDGWMK